MAINSAESQISLELQKLESRMRKGVQRILFVCMGNMCRSPAAEYLFRYELDRRMPGNIMVRSAGLLNIDGEPVPLHLQEIGKDFNIHLEEHRSSGLNRDKVEEAHLVFVMEESQKESIVSQFPDQAEKIFLLSLFDADQNGTNIHDPMGASVLVHRYTFSRILNLTQKLVDLLLGTKALG